MQYTYIENIVPRFGNILIDLRQAIKGKKQSIASTQSLKNILKCSNKRILHSLTAFLIIVAWGLKEYLKIFF